MARQLEWGHWQLNLATKCLEFREEGSWRYEVDLDRCKTSAQILDWLCQLLEKSWVTTTDVGCLLQALDDLSGGLQASVCGCGVDRGPIDWPKRLNVWE